MLARRAANATFYFLRRTPDQPSVQMPTQSGMSAPVKVMAPVLDGVDGVSGEADVSGQHGMTSLSLRALYAMRLCIVAPWFV